MDNFHIDVTSEGKSSLILAMRLAFDRGYKAVGYKIGDKGLVFYWTMGLGPKDVIKLPFTLDADGAADFASRWLEEQDYGRQPDHDGDNGKGWRVYTEAWGHVAGDSGSFVAVQPAWAMYGK